MVVTDLPESMLCMLKTHATIVLPALSPLHTIITFGRAEMHVVFMKFLNLLLQNLSQVVCPAEQEFSKHTHSVISMWDCHQSNT